MMRRQWDSSSSSDCSGSSSDSGGYGNSMFLMVDSPLAASWCQGRWQQAATAAASGPLACPPGLPARLLARANSLPAHPMPACLLPACSPACLRLRTCLSARLPACHLFGHRCVMHMLHVTPLP